MFKYITQSQQPETILGLLLDMLKWENPSFAGVVQMIRNKPGDVGNHLYPRVEDCAWEQSQHRRKQSEEMGRRKPIPDGILWVPSKDKSTFGLLLSYICQEIFVLDIEGDIEKYLKNTEGD